MNTLWFLKSYIVYVLLIIWPYLEEKMNRIIVDVPGYLYEIIKINLIKIVPYLFDVLIKCKLIRYFKRKKSFCYRLKKQVFQRIIKRLHNFISIRLFPPKPQDLPPMAKCTWWIPSATKVLALLSKFNEIGRIF